MANGEARSLAVSASTYRARPLLALKNKTLQTQGLIEAERGGFCQSVIHKCLACFTLRRNVFQAYELEILTDSRMLVFFAALDRLRWGCLWGCTRTAE